MWKRKLPVMDRTTLIAASAPTLLLLAIIVYVVYRWRKHRTLF